MRMTLPNPAPFRPPLRPLAPAIHAFERERQVTLFPPVPTLLATRLQLELLLCERSVDLRAASGIILNDLGATLEIFRRAGEECGAEWNAGAVASRLEDCLALLGTEAWMDAVCANAVERVAQSSAQLSELSMFWEHGRSLACACWLVAEHTEGMCPNEAYLVGLLHEAARLPELLSWEMPLGLEEVARWTAQALATSWHLPEYLHSVIAAPALPSRWNTLLRTAHAWSQGDATFLSHTA